RTTMPSTTMKSSTEDGGALPSIEGLDTTDGLLRVGGNRSLYLKLLRQFVAQQAETAASVAHALGAGNHTVAERLAHTVKDLAGNLGAGPVQAAAAALEQAIAGHGDAGVIASLQQRFAGELGALVTRLRSALGENAAPAVALPPAPPA